MMDYEEQARNLCRNIRWLRKTHGLSKSRMAAIMGISVKSLSLLESGVIPKRVGCDALWNIRVYFHVSIKDLFYPLNEPET